MRFVCCSLSLLVLSGCTIDRRAPAETMVPGGPGFGPGSFRADGIHACEYDATRNLLFWVNYNQGSVMKFEPITKRLQAIYFDDSVNFGTWMLRTTLPTQTTPEIWFGQENATAVKRVALDAPQFGMSSAHLG